MTADMSAGEGGKLPMTSAMNPAFDNLNIGLFCFSKPMVDEGFPDIPSANIPIQYNDPKGNLIKDNVLLIKRAGKWYLLGI